MDHLPHAASVISPNGDVMLELNHHGHVIAGVNMTAVVGGLFRRLGWFQPPAEAKQLGGGESP